MLGVNAMLIKTADATRMELCANQNEITIIFLQSPFVCTLFVRLQIVANSCSRMRGCVFFFLVC